ncbi:DUF3124 domain-containing protein [Desulfonema ishimotonii]|uniref:DUF3124 domain-containing protein n=1 Tax=Desulfonema ishimotonii TaxID=45657 RepID=A0A401FYK3_9BACT|nr:DUF3124 domain-containing protein [Desulfonema ishimotonii]GBC62049.1 DUF3124 domain-containing protein [Desulfonema ishimotonii]
MNTIRQKMNIWAMIFVLICGIPASVCLAGPEIPLWQGQTVYVPVYSHIYSGDRERPFDLAATLSIRNTDPVRSLTIVSADYYDSEGRLLAHYLKEPKPLGPMASVRYVVKESDREGGSGANFLVRWTSDRPVNAPVIQGVMIGTKNQQGISFLSQGQVIREHTPDKRKR